MKMVSGQDNFSSFIDKNPWPPNSPELNLLSDYSIWDEFGQSINWDKVLSKDTLNQEMK